VQSTNGRLVARLAWREKPSLVRSGYKKDFSSWRSSAEEVAIGAIAQCRRRKRCHARIWPASVGENGAAKYGMDVPCQPIPLTINGPSRVATPSGNFFQAAIKIRSLGLSGFKSGTERPAARRN